MSTWNWGSANKKEDTFVELLLDEVLDGFDIVVGDLLDFLDSTRLGKLELEVD